MQKRLYNHLNDFYKSIFKERVLKIPVDGGFSCPNRDGKKGYGGCIFCSSRGSGDRLNNQSIKEQIENYFKSFKAKKANKFLVYFQNFTNTYKRVDELKDLYNQALIDERIVGLDIATRCDAIDEEVCKLLNSYKDKYYVQVELGLQTSNETSHKFLNQNINNEEFITAMKLLNKYSIDVVIHIMIGLPNENKSDLINTINFLNTLNYQGIKIHSTYIEKDTGLYELYKLGQYSPITYEDYMNDLVYVIAHINPNIIIHRVTGDPYSKTFVCPEWMMHKKLVLNHLEERLKEENSYQGKYFNKD